MVPAADKRFPLSEQVEAVPLEHLGRGHPLFEGTVS